MVLHLENTGVVGGEYSETVYVVDKAEVPSTPSKLGEMKDDLEAIQSNNEEMMKKRAEQKGVQEPKAKARRR
ncbi:ANM_HP_G0242840.mRNA.1.CDS.1 [Saccharomyces cerevisiae]|nr:ANM_HP_G0242840.mRNA.1.CDS.1 [Saccharomyces cerevisiae]CAI7002473.1 ANM_HP_G0242840.mRNA.1.CDS.1 [Saccharomyces cerevisiae]